MQSVSFGMNANTGTSSRRISQLSESQYDTLCEVNAARNRNQARASAADVQEQHPSLQDTDRWKEHLVHLAETEQADKDLIKKHKRLLDVYK